MADPKDLDRIISGLMARRPDLAAQMQNSGETAESAAARIGKMRDARGAAKGRMKSIVGANPAAPGSAADESIIEMIDRPTSFVVNDDFDLPASPEIARRLEQARSLIKPRLASIGLVEVFDGSMKWPVGTAWMVAAGIAVTNRHVAETFAFLGENGKPEFLPDMRNRPFRATVDFAEEHGSSSEREVAVTEVVYMRRYPGPFRCSERTRRRTTGWPWSAIRSPTTGFRLKAGRWRKAISAMSMG
jgi:hypothetical protein